MTERLSILGGRRSGKSTWLGCTWLASRQPSSKLRATALPDALEPLKILSTELLARKYPARTNTSVAGVIRIPLVWDASPKAVEFELEVADFDGEEIESIFDLRQSAWTEAWRRRAEPSIGLLLFLRPSMAERISASRLQAGARTPDADSPEALFPGQTPADVKRDGSVAIPGEVALIETMQLMRAAREIGAGQPSPDRLGIVLSCWDELSHADAANGPDGVLAQAYPLLYDFIYTSHDPRRVQVFGLSATGVNLADEQARKTLINEDRQVADLGRVIWRAGRGEALQESSQVALPLGWMIEGDSALT